MLHKKRLTHLPHIAHNNNNTATYSVGDCHLYFFYFPLAKKLFLGYIYS